MTIRLLSTVLINQIAAGEVVDRPASIVKELIENSIDAGSARIDVQLERGGSTLIRVSDDGSGIAPTEMALAVASHATSKIAEEADLAAIASLGFRGEALASIGSISHLVLKSKQQGNEAATQIEVDGGSVSEPKPVAASVGTTIEIRRLFFNTPARRKFLKSDGAETTRVREVVQRLAASHHDISFTLKSGDRTLLEYPKTTPRDRLLSIFGGELSKQMIEVDTSVDGVTIWGLLGTPQIARPTSRHIRVHVNGRSVKDASITHALREGYRGLIEPGRFPTAAIFLEIDPTFVDVNVHPQKSEVRFRDRDAIWHLVHTTVSSALAEKDFVPAFQPIQRESGGGSFQKPSFGASNPPSFGASNSPSFGASNSPSFGASNSPSFALDEARKAVADIELSPPTPLPIILARDAVLQVHKCFLVTQDEQGILIIDQHALHERVMFEELRSRILQGNLESQRLLVPDAFAADAGQIEALELHAALFERLGIDASASGPASISVYALPTLLVSRNVDGGSFIRDLLDKLGSSDFPSSEEESLSEILDMMSCKAAIKAGDHLTQRELADLLRKRKEIERGSNCPHGRPTTMRVSIGELEQRFGRR